MGDSKEMPLWQQHLIQKQLEEIQRNNQFQQLEQETRQHDMLCQVASPRQSAQHRLLPTFNGMPINNKSSFMLHNDVVHAEPKTANGSNIFMMSNHHVPAKHLHATRFAPQQQFDHLLHNLLGTPVSTTRGLMSHYNQLQGMARSYTDAINKASMHSLALQNIQAKDFHNSDGETGWSNNLEQIGVGPSQIQNSLDPEEEKILFGKYDIGNLGDFLNDNSFKNADSFDAFPSLNSGSWSALMQDAVQSSRSEEGIQEERSDLSIQNPQSSITKHQLIFDNTSNDSSNATVRPLPVSDESSGKQMFNDTTQEQIQPKGVWSRNWHDQSNKSSHGNWNNRESISLSNSYDQPNGNITLFAQNGGNISGATNQLQSSQTQSIPIYGNNSISSDIDRQALSKYHYDHGKTAFSSIKPTNENVGEFMHQRNKIHQLQESSMTTAEQSPSMSNSWKSSGMSGWKPVGSQIFQLAKDADSSTTFPRSAFQKSQEHGNVASSQLIKGHANNLEEVQHRSSIFRQSSQTMHELLQSVDKSIASAPTYQIPPVSNHDLQSHASFLYSNGQQLDSTGFGHSIHPPNEALQKEHLEVKSFNSGQQHAAISQVTSEGNSSENSGSNLSYMGQQLQMWKQQQQQQLLHHQRFSNACKHESHSSQSLHRQAQNFQPMGITNQHSKTLSPNLSERILPSNLDPSFHLASIHNLKIVQSQQIYSTDVLHNIWANTSSRGSNEPGTCSQDSPNLLEGDKIPAEENSMTGFDSETCSALQDQEKTVTDYSNINSMKYSQSNYSLLKQMHASKDSSAPSDTRMLSFSSRENAEKIAVKTIDNIQIQSLPSVNSDNFEPSKKRRIEGIQLESWHQVVSLSIQRLQNVSLADHGWTQATNRLIDKLENVTEMIEGGLLVPRARRRLTLTTILMQKLLPPIPAPVLVAKATSAYESVTYFISKEALGDAHSLISCLRSDCGQEKEKATEKRKTSEKSNDLFSDVVEEVSGKLDKLESAFSRLDKRTSLLETRLSWEEVERISLINRLGKIHGKNKKADAVDISSTSHTAPYREIQRIVAGFSTAYVPHGVQCLSL